MRALRETSQFIENHPLTSLFLTILIIFGFLPFFVILAFVSSSFVVVAVSALAVVFGTFAVALFSFLVVLIPVLVTGGIMAVFVYLTFCFVRRLLGIVKRVKYKLFVSRRSRRRRCRLEESIQSVDFKIGPSVHYEHSLNPGLKEESFREEESLNGQISYPSY